MFEGRCPPTGVPRRQGQERVTQRDRKHDLQEEPEDEDRDRDADVRADHRDDVGRRVAPERRGDSQRDTNDGREQHRRDRQLDRHGHPFHDDVDHRPVEADRIVEVTVEDAVVAAAEDGRQQVQATALRHDRSLAAEDTEVDPELDRDRLVQPVALGERGAQLRRGLLTVRGDARVARDDPAEHEHEDHPEQHDDA